MSKSTFAAMTAAVAALFAIGCEQAATNPNEATIEAPALARQQWLSNGVPRLDTGGVTHIALSSNQLISLIVRG